MRAVDIQQILISLVKDLSGADKLQLTPGQVVSVTLKEVKGDTAVLDLNGREIPARLDLPVEAGETLRCMVEGERGGQIVLRVISSQGLAVQNLNDLLTSVGLAGNDINAALLSELIKNELPLNPQTARMVSSFLSSAAIQAEDAWIPVLMVKQGLPLTQEVFNSLKGILSDLRQLNTKLDTLLSSTGKNVEPQLKEQILNVKQAITQLQITPDKGTGGITSTLAELFRVFTGTAAKAAVSIPGHIMQQTAGQVPTLPLSQQAVQQPQSQQAVQQPQSQQAVQQPQLQQAVQQPLPGQVFADPRSAPIPSQGMPNGGISANTPQPVTEFVQQASKGPQLTEPNQPAIILSSGLGGTASKAGTSSHLRQGTDTSRETAARTVIERLSGLAEGSALTGGAKQSFLNTVSHLIAQSGQDNNISDLVSQLDGLKTALGVKGSTEHADMVQLTQSLAAKIDAVQNFNRADINPQSTIVIYSTVRFEDREEPIRLLVNYRNDNKQKKRDFSNCRLEVTLNTPSLGHVNCEVKVNDKHLALQFITDNRRAAAMLEQSGQMLAARLTAMDFRVNMLPGLVREDVRDTTTVDDGIPGMYKLNLRV